MNETLRAGLRAPAGRTSKRYKVKPAALGGVRPGVNLDKALALAKTQLSRLVEQVNAGEEVVITRHGRPVARPVPAAAAKPRKPGLLEAKGLLERRRLRCAAAGRSARPVRGQGQGGKRGAAVGLLLDPHPFVWFLVDPRRIPGACRG